MERLANILHLGTKELPSLQHDLVLVLLILWAFSMGIYSAATKMPESLHNAAIAVVDEDQSQLSERLVQAFQAPYFRTPERIDLGQMDQGMDSGRYTFTLNIPPPRPPGCARPPPAPAPPRALAPAKWPSSSAATVATCRRRRSWRCACSSTRT